MAISRVQINGGTSTGDNTRSETFTTTPVAGDLLVAYFAWNGPSAASLAGPPGWTVIPTDGVVRNGRVNHSVFYKISDGTEKTVTGQFSGGTCQSVVVLIEYAGADPAPLDKSAHNSGSSTTADSGTTIATTQGTEMWIGFLTSERNITQSTPTNGFTQIKSLATGGGTQQERVRGAVYEKFVTATGTAHVAATIDGTAEDWVGTMITMKAGPLPPGAAALTGAGSMTAMFDFPNLVLGVQAAFGSGPRTESPTWTEISPFVRGCSWARGRQNELNQIEAGTATVTLKDPASYFDPDNTSSPFYPNVKPGLPVRAYAAVGTSVYPLFYQFLERLPRTLRVTTVYTERQMQLVDGFALLAASGLGGNSYEDELSGTRVANVLDDVGWPASRRSIDVGASTLGQIGFAQEDDTRAQTHLQAVADSENGLLFVNGSGYLVFVDRHQLIQNAVYTESLATFQDANS
jgi:hypothetical protein